MEFHVNIHRALDSGDEAPVEEQHAQCSPAPGSTGNHLGLGRHIYARRPGRRAKFHPPDGTTAAAVMSSFTSPSAG